MARAGGVRIRCLACGAWTAIAPFPPSIPTGPSIPIGPSTPAVAEVPPAGGPACPGCGAALVSIPADRAVREGMIDRCLQCGRDRFWLRRDFAPRWGIAIVIAGAVLAPFTRYVSLGVTALLDLVLHRALPDVTICYWCDSEYRRFAKNPVHRAFDLHVAERFSRPGKYRKD